MKRAYSLIAAAAILVFSSTAAAQVCSSPINLTLLSRTQQIARINSAFSAPCTYEVSGNCEICFTMNEFAIDPTDGITGFSLSINGIEARNIYVVGLKLSKLDTLITNNPILSVNHSGTGTLYLENITLSDVKNGLQLAGTGKIQVGSYNDNKTVITGDSAKSGACIDVKAPGAVLSAVQASSCNEGVKVDANNVVIKDKSAIASNHLGVHVSSGITGTDVKSSLVYANSDDDTSTIMRQDGIRIDDGAMNEVVFYDVVNNEPTELLDGEDVIDYGNKKPYMLLNIPENKKGRVEFYLSVREDCGVAESAYGQNCAVLEGMTNPVEIAATTLAQGPVEATLPPQYLSKPIVVVFSDDERGTAGISKQFSFSGNDRVVAFVANPYDIPTSGGAVDTGSNSSDDDDETSGANSMGGEGVVSEGGGGIISAANAAGGCGGGASLLGLTWHEAGTGGILWCILIAVSAIAAARMVVVKIPARRRRR